MMLSFSTHPLHRRAKGFTLVELLVSISIITLLAAMILVALAGVQENAKTDRTRAQIARIDALISEIDADDARKGRPLVIVAHSFGAMAGHAIAARLGPRVRHLTIVAARGPAATSVGAA